jgi:hypothetical protein
MSETIHSRPLPKRPENGLLAWQATIGYISSEYSPDAMLTMRAYPAGDEGALWLAAATWGQESETVRDITSLPAALRDLWPAVQNNHTIFKTLEAATKSPSHYRDDQWVDFDTEQLLDRLLQVANAAFGGDWLFMLVYQPVTAPSARVQARLVAQNNSVIISGRGPSVHDACRDLYHNAAPGLLSRFWQWD